MLRKFYILKDKKPVLATDFIEYALWMDDDKNRIVEKTEIGNILVSTVFLGIDHSWGGGSPVLFETMIFGGEYDEHQQRYCSWEAAEKGHNLMCNMVLHSFSIKEKGLKKLIIDSLN